MIAISAGSRSNSFFPPASRRATTPNGFTVERRVTTRSGSPSWWMIRPSTSVSTTSPRWRLSSMPFRMWRTRIGVGAFARLVVRGLRDGPRAAPFAAEGPGWTVTMEVSGLGKGSGGGRRGYRDGCYDGRPRVRPPPGGPDRSMPTPNLHVSQHPAVLHKLAILRDEDTEPKKFREVVRELSWLLGYEALADVGVRPREIRTPMEPMTAHELGERVGFVPILRAGLGMVDAMLELMPTAQVWHLGLFRDERTLRPVEYYNKLPDSATVDLCLILDPMLATGGSATAAIEVLKKWGAVRIKLVNLIAAPEGVAAVAAAHPDVPIYTAALDRQLNERGYIVPGLGDAGDRQFGTGRAG